MLDGIKELLNNASLLVFNKPFDKLSEEEQMILMNLIENGKI